MAGSRTLKLNILADTKDLVDGLKKANGQVTNAQSGIAAAFDKVKVAAVAATAAGAAFAVKYGRDAILAASDLAETVSKAGVIFGDSAKQIEAFAETAATGLGQSKQQAIDAASTFAVFGKSAGLAGDDLVKFSTDFTTLASDLASFNNTSPEEAILAIGSALRGEAEPLRRYGVLLDDASLRQAALELGIVSTTKNALTPQQKVLAAQELIFQQTGDAQGDFARTSDGLANSQRILAAQLDNVKTTIGTALLPIATELFGEFSRRLIPAVEGFANTFQEDLIPYLENQVFPAFGELKDSILGIGDALQSASADADAANAVIQALETTIVEFVPVTLGALDAVVDAWATFLDILNRVRAFLSGDLATATRQFENRFRDTGKEVNNVNESMVNAYKQFQFFNKQTREQTIPNVTKTTTAVKELTSSITNKSTAVKKAADDVEILYNATDKYTTKTKAATKATTDYVDATLRRRFIDAEVTKTFAGGAGSVVGAFSNAADAAALRALIAQAENTPISELNLGMLRDPGSAADLEIINLAQEIKDLGAGRLGFADLRKMFEQFQVTNIPFITAGSAEALTQSLGRRGTTAAEREQFVQEVNIYVQGALADPEGTARAVQQVIQDSNARSGFQQLTPVLGLE